MLCREKSPTAAAAAPERPVSYTNARVSQHADSESPDLVFSRPGTTRRSLEDAEAEVDGALLVPAAPLARDMSSLSNPWQRLSEQSFAAHVAASPPAAASASASALRPAGSACTSREEDSPPFGAATNGTRADGGGVTPEAKLRLREKGAAHMEKRCAVQYEQSVL